MFCPGCGKNCPDNAVTCPNCGRSLTQAPNSSYSQPYTPPTQNYSNDNGSIGWGLLACCSPLIGLILYLVWKDNKPRTADVICKGAIIGFVIGLVSSILTTCMGASAGYYY